MSRDSCILSIDIGTTATKSTVVTRDGRIVARGQSGYPQMSSEEATDHFSAEYWWEATITAVRQCLKALKTDFPSWDASAIAALSFSGQMQDVILLRGGKTIRPVIFYFDARAEKEATHIAASVGADRWHAITGNLQDGSSPLAKLLWIKNNEPHHLAGRDSVSAAAQSDLKDLKILFGAHDYVAWRASGQTVTDPTNASTTGLFDLSTREWSPELIDAVGLDPGTLPAVISPEMPVGGLKADAARELGLLEGIPVFHGCGDAAATTIGAGAGEPGKTYLYSGTSGWIAISRDGERADPETGIFTLAHPQVGRYIIVGPMLTTGGNLDWLRDSIFSGAPFDTVEKAAGEAPVGSSGVTYMPYLQGERSPFRDSRIRAGFTGISRTTTRSDLARSVYEGIAFGFRSIADTIADLQSEGGMPLFVAGGGSRSQLLCQSIAEVINCHVHRLAAPEDVAALGAAIVAGKGLGWYDSYYPGDSFFPVENTLLPDPGNVTRYNEVYRAFKEKVRMLRS